MGAKYLWCQGSTNITGGTSGRQTCYQTSGNIIAQIWLDFFITVVQKPLVLRAPPHSGLYRFVRSVFVVVLTCSIDSSILTEPLFRLLMAEHFKFWFLDKICFIIFFLNFYFDPNRVTLPRQKAPNSGFTPGTPVFAH